MSRTPQDVIRAPLQTDNTPGTQAYGKYTGVVQAIFNPASENKNTPIEKTAPTLYTAVESWMVKNNLRSEFRDGS